MLKQQSSSDPLSCARTCLKVASVEAKREAGNLVGSDYRSSTSGMDQTRLNDTGYTVQGTTPEREAVLRRQIEVMQAPVLPYRIRFVTHWQYLYAAHIYRLHVPTGMTSLMFTHLQSRSVFIDEDRYLGEDWMGHWIAHELGHLATNSVREEDAEKAAAEYRRRLKSQFMADTK